MEDYKLLYSAIDFINYITDKSNPKVIYPIMKATWYKLKRNNVCL